MTGVLRGRHDVTLSYRRSLGGAERLFLSGLARAEIWGSRDADGRVTVPPVDWDPESGAPVVEFVRLDGRGIVRSWTWIADPGPDDPLEQAFALALVQVQGADTALLHVVDAEEKDMRTGLAVRPDWRAERVGSILDLRAFVPCPAGEPAVPVRGTPETVPDLEVVSDVRLAYTYEPGVTLTGFLRSLSQRRIEGGRCSNCAGVYVPPHPFCPACRTGPLATVQMSERGTITSYTVVHTPFHGMTIDLPFVCAWIRLDGASVPFAHLLGEVSPDEVRVGQRVEAVWVPDQELGPTWESIRYFRPARS